MLSTDVIPADGFGLMVIIYGEESGNANVPMVRDAMNIIADIYDEFCTIEKSRKDYEQYVREASSKV